jgi:DNA-binding response OmpR family regulator
MRLADGMGVGSNGPRFIRPFSRRPGEDEELLRLYAADLLAAAGYKVIDVPSADAALEAMAEQPDIRVLFTDIQMPGKLDGIQLARRVHEKWPEVLLLITSGGRQPAKAEIADHGHFIAKPYLPSDVLNDIVAMDKRRMCGRGASRGKYRCRCL